MSIKPGTVIKIYKDTSHFEDGAISRVLDYDPMQKEYLVGENIGEDDYWVKESDLEEVKFEKRKNNLFHDILAFIFLFLAAVGFVELVCKAVCYFNI